jgi:hypothetical protein
MISLDPIDLSIQLSVGESTDISRPTDMCGGNQLICAGPNWSEQTQLIWAGNQLIWTDLTYLYGNQLIWVDTANLSVSTEQAEKNYKSESIWPARIQLTWADSTDMSGSNWPEWIQLTKADASDLNGSSWPVLIRLIPEQIQLTWANKTYLGRAN